MTDTSPATPPIPVPPTPPRSDDHQPGRHGFNALRIVIGLIVILFGLQLLAGNYGWNWRWNIDFGRLWPVIIVLIGISFLSRGHVINRTVGLVLTLAVIAMVAILIVAKPVSDTRENIHYDISIPAETAATSAKVTLNMGAASVNVGGGSDQAVSGTFDSTFADLSTVSTIDVRQQRIDLTTRNRGGMNWTWFGNMRNTINLKLSDKLPTDLTVDSGAASLDLDLRTIQATNVSVDAGASSINLKLGDKVDTSTVVVKSGASSIDVWLPKTVDGVKVHIDAGMSGKNIPSSLKSKGDGNYESDGYAQAKKKIDLSIDAGASSINLN